MSRLNDARTRQQTVYFPVLSRLLSVLCVLTKIFSPASAKKKGGGEAYGFTISQFYDSFSNDIMAVKGLTPPPFVVA